MFNYATIVRERDGSGDDCATRKEAFGKWFDEQGEGQAVLGSESLKPGDCASHVDGADGGDAKDKKRMKLGDSEKATKKTKTGKEEGITDDKELKSLLGIGPEENVEDPLQSLIENSKASLRSAHGVCLKIQEQIASTDNKAGSIEQATKKSLQGSKSALGKQMKTLGKATFNKKIDMQDFQEVFGEHDQLVKDADELMKKGKSVSEAQKKKGGKDEKDKTDKKDGK